MDRKNFLKGMVKGYEDESIRRKQEEDLRVRNILFLFFLFLFFRKKKNLKKKEEELQI